MLPPDILDQLHQVLILFIWDGCEEGRLLLS
jgi:hypothetical protein